MSQKPQHTPAPWQIDAGVIYINGRPADRIFRHYMSGFGKLTSYYEYKANMALVAAAPDLLQLAEDMIAAIPGPVAHLQELQTRAQSLVKRITQ